MACRLRVASLLLLLLWPPPPPPGSEGGGVAGAVAGVVHLEAPRTVMKDATLDLHCRFHSLGADVYTVKWYKDGSEFFRVAPDDAKPSRAYPVAGVRVDKEASNASHVRLLAVGAATTGKFSCEVTEDAPTFSVFMDLKTVQVVEVEGSAGPTLSGLKELYRPGEVLNAGCVGPWSKPAVQLHWHLNGHPVPVESVQTARPEERLDGLLRPALFLRVPVPVPPPPSPVRLRCTAHLYEAYHKVEEVAVQIEETTRVPFVVKEPKEFPSERSSAEFPRHRFSTSVSSLPPTLFLVVTLLLA